MKRLIPLLLLALWLCGCGSETAAPAETGIPGGNHDSEPIGFYDPDSRLEEATGGAVQVYPLNRNDCRGMLPMGSDLILFAGTDTTTLIKLSGSTLYIAAQTELNCTISPEDPGVQVSEKGVTFYDRQNHELVFLDTGLKEVSRFSLPEDIQGSPALSADRKKLYYCTEDTLKVLDLETGFHKLLKEMFFTQQTIGGLHCGDTVVECDIVRSGGEAVTYFFSADTGETLWEATEELTLTTLEDFYFAVRADGAYQELLTGTTDIGPWALYFEESSAAMALPELGAALLAVEAADAVTLHYFELSSGRRTAQLELSGAPRSAWGSPGEACLWLLSYDDDAGCDAIYRWDPRLSPTGDETVYIATRITAENPDTEGLLRCRQMAEEISEAYDVDIRIWTDAVKESPQSYTLTAEYQVSAVENSLRTLRQALARYPEDFLKQAARGTNSGAIQICIVRFIESTSDSMPDDITGLQFWNSSEDACVYLEAGTELEQSLYRELFHIIESRVISTCSAYDGWNDLNPEGFLYDYDYRVNQTRDDHHLTEGEDRAFIDIRSMSFPTEDRAKVMEYAMMEGNEDFFSSPILQAKLRTLCEGIRQAFKLQDATESLPWEQYLAQPLT